MDDVTDERIIECAEYVYEKYKQLGGNNKVAKGTSLIESIISDDFITSPFNLK